MIRFDMPVARGGYAWWYIDALSDDGLHGLTLIAFVGSVFSPYYAWANRREGGGDPEDHVAMNVALYGTRQNYWTMTERRRRTLRREADSLVIGPSRLDWDGATLVARVTELACPVPQPVRGVVRLTPRAIERVVYPLDGAGAHRWRPIAPCARISVDFEKPGLSWQGEAYFDHNEGDGPLADGFTSWNWSRAATRRGAMVFYHAKRRDGGSTELALSFAASGGVAAIEAPPPCPLPMSWWRIARETRSDGGTEARLIRSFEDTPFYARARIGATVDGEAVDGVHETVDLDRLRSPIVQAMLPFRMPRRLI